jgi:hypothetical protein
MLGRGSAFRGAAHRRKLRSQSPRATTVASDVVALELSVVALDRFFGKKSSRNQSFFVGYGHFWKCVRCSFIEVQLLAPFSPNDQHFRRAVFVRVSGRVHHIADGTNQRCEVPRVVGQLIKRSKWVQKTREHVLRKEDRVIGFQGNHW